MAKKILIVASFFYYCRQTDLSEQYDNEQKEDNVLGGVSYTLFPCYPV